MLLGFSTGALHKHMSAKQALQLIRDIGCSTVELGFVRKSRIDQGWLDEIEVEDLEGFQYVSLHAPAIDYEDNKETREILKQIERIHAKRPLDLVVFHPDEVEDIKVFDSVSFPIGFENMDNLKSFGKNPQDIDKLLGSNSSFRMVLDVNHLKTNDSTMKLADEFYAKLGDKIAEYHISGLGDVEPHIPLFQSQQQDILDAIRDFSKPIICESLLTPDTIEQEKKYIEEHIIK